MESAHRSAQILSVATAGETRRIIPNRQGLRYRALLLAVMFGFAPVGCVYTGRTEISGRAFNQDALNQITIGKTTRADVIKLFGLPDSMFVGQARLVDAKYFAGIGRFYLHIEDRYLTSLDDKHYAVLYRFSKLSGQSHRVTLGTLSSGNTAVRINSDEILLIINKDTDIIEDIAYRKETS
ncbi:MAG TPA: hypothetical protein VJ646_18720 [Candidatus Binatia bacterium]|nr:hypothetical protein [Candidatus Binatia bacterium]